MAATPSHLVRGACPHDCPDTCAMHVTVEDGRAVKVATDQMRGRGCHALDPTLG